LELPLAPVAAGVPNPKADGVVAVGIPPNIDCPVAGCGACEFVVVVDASPNLKAENDEGALLVGGVEAGVVVV